MRSRIRPRTIRVRIACSLAARGAAAGEDVGLSVFRQELHLHLGRNGLPVLGQQMRLAGAQSRARGSDQVVAAAGAQLIQVVLRNDPAVKNPDPAHLPMARFHVVDHRQQRRHIDPVAVEKLIGDR